MASMPQATSIVIGAIRRLASTGASGIAWLRSGSVVAVATVYLVEKLTGKSPTEWLAEAAGAVVRPFLDWFGITSTEEYQAFVDRATTLVAALGSETAKAIIRERTGRGGTHHSQSVVQEVLFNPIPRDVTLRQWAKRVGVAIGAPAEAVLLCRLHSTMAHLT